MAQAESQVVMSARGAASRVERRKFYVALAVLMTLLVFVGFWPSYYGPLTRGTARAPLILHAHGVIFIGWMALLIVQATLGARGHMRAHRALGNVGIGYGVVLWVVGLIVSFVAPVLHVNAGEWSIDEAATFLLIPVGDMVLFGSFFAAAVAYRRQPEIHKRLMLLATIAIVFAAAFRLQGSGVSQPVAIGIWYSPLVLAMAYDVWRRGRVHPVYVIGGVAMAVALLRLPLGETELWLGVGRPLFEALT